MQGVSLREFGLAVSNPEVVMANGVMVKVVAVALASRPRRRDVRDVVVAMLEHWGYWERLGIYGAAVQRSALGRLVKDGPGSGGGDRCRSALPPGLSIPSDVVLTGRMVASMRADCRAGEAYYRAIRAKYVSGGPVDKDALHRATNALVKFFLSRSCQSAKNVV